MSRRAHAVGPTVLTLDRALHDPLFASVLAQRSGRTSGWFADQVAAAGREAVAVSARVVAHGKFDKLTEGHTCDLPAWLRLGAFTALVEWTLGQGSTCLHAPDAKRPEPVYAVAWRPGLVTCSRCMHLFALRHASERDRMCDACGKVVAGIAADDPIRPSMVHIANLTYSVGTCRECVWD